MSARKARPGDVAMVTYASAPNGGRFGREGSWVTPGTFISVAAIPHPSEDGVVWTSSGGGAVHDGRRDVITAVRPLLVLDPEDAKQMQAMADALTAARDSQHSMSVSKAVRAMLEPPAPPKPDEPTELGAVVQDKQGAMWVRIDSGPDHLWRQCDLVDAYRSARWSEIDAATILSPGITPDEPEAEEALPPDLIDEEGDVWRYGVYDAGWSMWGRRKGGFYRQVVPRDTISFVREVPHGTAVLP